MPGVASSHTGNVTLTNVVVVNSLSGTAPVFGPITLTLKDVHLELVPKAAGQAYELVARPAVCLSWPRPSPPRG